MNDPGRNLLCVRKADVTNRDSTFAELQGAIFRMFGEQYKRYWYINSSNMLLECKSNHNKIIFRGMNDEKQREKLKSITFKRGKLTDVWIEEATEITQSDFEIIDDRLRGELPQGQFYQIRLTFNPVSAHHWIKKVFFDREDPDVLTHQSTYENNRFIDEAYHRRMLRRKEVDPEGYRVYGLGEWGEVAGLILKNYVVEEFDRSRNAFDYMVNAQDFGFNHANCIGELDSRMGSCSCAVSCMCTRWIRMRSFGWLRGNLTKGLICGVTPQSRIESRCGRKRDIGQSRSIRNGTVFMLKSII